MKKVMEVIKQVFAGIGATAIAVFLFLLGRGTKRDSSTSPNGFAQNDKSNGSASSTMNKEKIEGKCNEKRNEALERLSNTDARKLSENYGAVCDAITDGKLRFRNRCRELDGKGNSDYGNR